MAEIRTVTTLRSKRDDVLHSIRLYERKLEQARADLAHLSAAIRIFEASGDPKEMSRYVNTRNLFRYGEQAVFCKSALAEGPMTTRELALHIMKAKGLDTGDKVLAKAVANRMINSLRSQWHAGKIVLAGKRHGVSVWQLP